MPAVKVIYVNRNFSKLLSVECRLQKCINSLSYKPKTSYDKFPYKVFVQSPEDIILKKIKIFKCNFFLVFLVDSHL